MAIAGAAAGASNALEQILARQMLEAQMREQQEMRQRDMAMREQQFAETQRRNQFDMDRAAQMDRVNMASGLVNAIDAQFDPGSVDENAPELTPVQLSKIQGTPFEARVRTTAEEFQGPYEELGEEAGETRPEPVEVSRLAPTGQQVDARRQAGDARLEQANLFRIADALSRAKTEAERRQIAAEAFGMGIQVPTSLTGLTEEEKLLIAGGRKEPRVFNVNGKLVVVDEKGRGRVVYEDAPTGRPKLTPSIEAALTNLRGAVTQLADRDAKMTRRSGVSGRVDGAARAFMGRLGSDEDAEAYAAIGERLIPALARAAGEVGNLAEKEQARYQRLVPRVSDGLNIRREKFKAIAELIEFVESGATADDFINRMDQFELLLPSRSSGVEARGGAGQEFDDVDALIKKYRGGQ